jgi:hypothetical protein
VGLFGVGAVGFRGVVALSLFALTAMSAYDVRGGEGVVGVDGGHGAVVVGGETDFPDATSAYERGGSFEGGEGGEGKE